MKKKDLNRYMALKKVGYIYNLLESEAKSKNDIDALESYKVQQQVFMSQLDEDSLKIYLNTYNFPYDLTLYKYLEHKKLSTDIIYETSNYFGIDSNLVIEKINEYVKHTYLHLINSDTKSSFSQLAEMVDSKFTKKGALEVNNSEIKQK